MLASYQQSHVSLGTSSLGWRWPWSDLFIVSTYSINSRPWKETPLQSISCTLNTTPTECRELVCTIVPTYLVEECSIKRERSGWFCVLRCRRARNMRGKNRLLSPQPQVCIQLKKKPSYIVVPASLLRKEMWKVHSWLHCYLKGMCVMPDVLHVYSYEFRIREGRGEGGGGSRHCGDRWLALFIARAESENLLREVWMDL